MTEPALACPGLDGPVDPALAIPLGGGAGRLRPFAEGDRDALAERANDRSVWRNLTDRFPHPYTREDAEGWIALNASAEPPGLNLVIEAGGVLAGGIGVEGRSDVHGATAEVGYWLGRAFWGRGLATNALRVLTPWVFAHSRLERLDAEVLGWNPASARVLEKAGYRLEGRKRRAIRKDGETTDALIYGIVRSDLA